MKIVARERGKFTKGFKKGRGKKKKKVRERKIKIVARERGKITKGF